MNHLKTRLGVPTIMLLIATQFVGGARGSGVTQAREEKRPAIAFVSERAADDSFDIYTAAANGTNVQGPLSDQINIDLDPSFSPDGSQIAYTSLNPSGANAHIWVMNSDGSNGVQMSARPDVYEWEPEWSPSGDTILFARQFTLGAEEQLWIATQSSPGVWEEQQLTESGEHRQPTYSPDGERIAFGYSTDEKDEGRQDIYVMNSDGSGRPRALTSSAAGDEGTPTWSPDGRKIAFADFQRGGVYVMRADGRNKQRVIGGDAPAASVDWSPGGKKLIYYVCPRHQHSCRIKVLTLGSSSGPKTIIDAPEAFDGQPHWNPVGA